MKKVTIIDTQKLEKAGFLDTKYGFCKKIPNCFRFCYTLYFLPKDTAGIYGTISGKMGGDECLDFEDWLERLCFRTPEKREEIQEWLLELETSGAIIVDELEV